MIFSVGKIVMRRNQPQGWFCLITIFPTEKIKDTLQDHHHHHQQKYHRPPSPPQQRPKTLPTNISPNQPIKSSNPSPCPCTCHEWAKKNRSRLAGQTLLHSILPVFCYALKYAEFDLISLAFFVLLFFAKDYLLTSQEQVCSGQYPVV